MPPFLQHAQHYGPGLQQLGEDVGSQWGPAGWPNSWPEEEALLPSTELSSSHQIFRLQVKGGWRSVDGGLVLSLLEALLESDLREFLVNLHESI